MEENPSPQAPVQNWIVFALLATAIWFGYPLVLQKFFPPKPPVAMKIKSDDKDGIGPVAAAKGSAAEAAAKSTAMAGSPKSTAATAVAAPIESKSTVAAANQTAEKAAGDAKKEAKPPDNAIDGKVKDDKAKQAGMGPALPPAFPTEWITLGSADPKSHYRMLATLGNRGASLVRIELSSDRYRDCEDRSGYLGHLVVDATDKKPGCLVQVVGDGTPAALAGIQSGDRITKLDTYVILGSGGLDALLEKTKPGQSVQVTWQHNAAILTETIRLTRRPLEVVSPEDKAPPAFQTQGRRSDPTNLEKACPLSLLMTMQQIDKATIPTVDESKETDIDIDHEISRELPGVGLRDQNWDLVRHDQESAEFRAVVRAEGRDVLEVRKTFHLVKTDDVTARDPDGPAYHLVVGLELKNIDAAKQSHSIAYRLDGPTGLPHEGAWYVNKLAMKSGGLRDVVYKMTKGGMSMTTCAELNDKPLQTMFEASQVTENNLPLFYGVDAQYFAAILLPKADTTAGNVERALALRVGDVDKDRRTVTNTSLRVISKSVSLAPDQSLSQSYELFAGPKRPNLLNEYGLDDLIYYGWFKLVCQVMATILNFFFSIFHNYGLAVIGLTVIVRLCMFPLSRYQAKSMQLMQKMQPEMKRINDKYKNDLDGRTKATEELFRKHNTSQANQLSGCLIMFVQLPIFFGLYRSLQTNVDLRDAPLISEAVRWCSNLAAPDMLYDWSWMMPGWFNAGVGIFALGPYFNLLPILTLGLFFAQQKLLMPPPADEQAVMQQKVMSFMMIFIGISFFKVASGLCIYFIASTLWGLAERQFLPKKVPAEDGEPQLSTQSPYPRMPRNGDSDGNGDAQRRKKKRRK